MKKTKYVYIHLLLGAFILLGIANANANGISGPKEYVEIARSILINTTPADTKSAERIDKAIAHLDDSLNAAYWSEGGTFISELTPEGKRAFIDMRLAAAELEKIDNYSSDVEAALTYLFQAACDLAENVVGLGTLTITIIDVILEMEEETDLYTKSTEKALEQFRDALQEHDVFDIDRAIKHFSNSWKYAS